MKIDLNRGVFQRRHPVHQTYISMYQDAPGLYYDESGKEVPESMAREAGHDVEHWGRERRVTERVKEAEAQARRDLAEREEMIRRDAASDTDEDVVTIELAKEQGFSLQHLGNGRYQIERPDGELVSTRKLKRPEAVAALRELLTPGPASAADGAE